jgi:hypothetical protein
MITPPLSISAMPRLTRAVPVTGACPLPADGRFADGVEGDWDSVTVYLEAGKRYERPSPW